MENKNNKRDKIVVRIIDQEKYDFIMDVNINSKMDHILQSLTNNIEFKKRCQKINRYLIEKKAFFILASKLHQKKPNTSSTTKKHNVDEFCKDGFREKSISYVLNFQKNLMEEDENNHKNKNILILRFVVFEARFLSEGIFQSYGRLWNKSVNQQKELVRLIENHEKSQNETKKCKENYKHLSNQLKDLSEINKKLSEKINEIKINKMKKINEIKGLRNKMKKRKDEKKNLEEKYEKVLDEKKILEKILEIEKKRKKEFLKKHQVKIEELKEEKKKYKIKVEELEKKREDFVKREVEKVQNENKNLNKRVKELESLLNKDKIEITSLEKKRKRLERKVIQLQDEIQKQKMIIAKLELEKATIARRVFELEKNVLSNRKEEEEIPTLIGDKGIFDEEDDLKIDGRKRLYEMLSMDRINNDRLILKLEQQIHDQKRVFQKENQRLMELISERERYFQNKLKSETDKLKRIVISKDEKLRKQTQRYINEMKRGEKKFRAEIEKRNKLHEEENERRLEQNIKIIDEMNRREVIRTQEEHHRNEREYERLKKEQEDDIKRVEISKRISTILEELKFSLEPKNTNL